MMMKKKYSDDDILKSFQEAPPAVKEILSSTELVDIIFDIVKNNALPTNKAPLIAEYNRNLLLGITSPAEVLGNLIFTGIPAQTAQEILEELNQKVFIPTHEKTLQEKQPTQEQEHVATNTSPTPSSEKYSSVEPEDPPSPPTRENPEPELEPLPPTAPSAPIVATAPDTPSYDSATQEYSPTTPKTNTSQQTIENPPIKKHTADPYRESFD